MVVIRGRNASKMRVLITGANGFVGNHLSRYLTSRGMTCVALDVKGVPEAGSYEVRITWDELDTLDLSTFDGVIHLAGKAHDTKNTSDAQSYFDINVGLTKRIVGAVLKCESSKVLKFETPRQGEAVPSAEGPLRLVYVGNMGRGYDLETLVRAVGELNSEGLAIRLALAGGGEQELALKRLAHATPAITFKGVVRGEGLRALLEQADVGVVPLFSSTHVAVPYKLADYTAAGLPVVNSLRGETAQLLDRYGCGWSYEAGSVASLKQALREACELKQREAGAFDARRAKARLLAEECFDAERIYPEFVKWLEDFCDHLV